MPIKLNDSECIVVIDVYILTIIHNMYQSKDSSINLEEAKAKQKAAVEKFGLELRQAQERKDLAQWKANNSQKLSSTLNKLSAGDKAVCEVFQKLSNTCGGDAKLNNLFGVYLATKRMNS